MIRQTKRPGDEMDFGLYLPWPVDAGWYERYWYGDRSPSRFGVLVNVARQLCRKALSAARRVDRRLCETRCHRGDDSGRGLHRAGEQRCSS